MCCFKCGSLLRDKALFCEDCDTLRRNITHDPNGSSLDSLIKYYFRKEVAYQTVVDVLDAFRDIQISLRTLKHKLKTMQLANVNFKGHLQDMGVTSSCINSIQHMKSK